MRLPETRNSESKRQYEQCGSKRPRSSTRKQATPIQKPLSTNVERTSGVASLLRSQSVQHGVRQNFWRRFDAEVQHAFGDVTEVLGNALAFGAVFQVACQHCGPSRFQFAIEIGHHFFGVERVL